MVFMKEFFEKSNFEKKSADKKFEKLPTMQRLDYSTCRNNKLQHEISINVVCVTSKASQQPTHMPTLIRAFASHLNILWVLSYWLNIIWSF